MSAILPSLNIDSNTVLAKYFLPYQLNWIEAEESIHAQHKQVFALAEKSIRIGWTYCDSFKNVRKRLRFQNRDYLFVSKDYPSSLEYLRRAYEFAGIFNYTRAIVSRGEEFLKVPRLDENGRRSGFTDEIKIGVIKFDNGSRILAFSAHPQAMAVYGGDVGLDEFAKHPNSRLLWETAQGRVTWGFDMAVWSAHDGEDTLFYQFAQQARAGKGTWNLYYRVTMPDAIELGLLELINRVRGTLLTPDQFMADCRTRAGLEEIFEQSYLCNPVPGASGIVDWSTLERCRFDYAIERLHLEADEVRQQFGDFIPDRHYDRQEVIRQAIRARFPKLFKHNEATYRLGFDVAASGHGDLTAIYIDEFQRPNFWLRALFTCRTDDWHFIQSVLHTFVDLPFMQAAGDETGLGREVCWHAFKRFGSRFTRVNFASQKQDLGFALMNQLSVAEKRFPRNEQDIAADYFALRKKFHGKTWVFSEGPNTFNPASHCDIAWAGGLASLASKQSNGIFVTVG